VTPARERREIQRGEEREERKSERGCLRSLTLLFDYFCLLPNNVFLLLSRFMRVYSSDQPATNQIFTTKKKNSSLTRTVFPIFPFRGFTGGQCSRLLMTVQEEKSILSKPKPKQSRTDTASRCDLYAQLSGHNKLSPIVSVLKREKLRLH